MKRSGLLRSALALGLSVVTFASTVSSGMFSAYATSDVESKV